MSNYIFNIPIFLGVFMGSLISCTDNNIKEKQFKLESGFGVDKNCSCQNARTFIKSIECNAQPKKFIFDYLLKKKLINRPSQPENEENDENGEKQKANEPQNKDSFELLLESIDPKFVDTVKNLAYKIIDEGDIDSFKRHLKSSSYSPESFIAQSGILSGGFAPGGAIGLGVSLSAKAIVKLALAYAKKRLLEDPLRRQVEKECKERLLESNIKFIKLQLDK